MTESSTTMSLSADEVRLLQRSLELAAGYADSERDQHAIFELSAKIRRAKTLPT